MSNYFQERVSEISKIPLKTIIEEFGGTFISSKNFYHPAFGYEKTPAAFVYERGGKEYWKHFKLDKSGDAIDFIKEIYSISSNIEAVNKILGEDRSFKSMDESKHKEQLEKEKKAKEDKERKWMFAIQKNSVPLLDSDLGLEYFMKRGLERTILTFKDNNIDIRVNSFQGKDGKRVNNIVYSFSGHEKKDTHEFMILKGIDDSGRKNGVKLNIMTCRPVLHFQECKSTFIVCEGMEDALSGLELGKYKNFISLNSTSSVNKLIMTMNTSRKWFANNALDLCLDNDATGKYSTKKIKVFSNLVSLYQNGGLNELKSILKDRASLNNALMDKCKYSIKLLNDTTDIKTANSNIVLTLVKNLTEILPNDYFCDYGKVFNIKESKYYKKMIELGRNDLNEMLVKDYKKKSLDDIINSIQTTSSAPKINQMEYAR